MQKLRQDIISSKVLNLRFGVQSSHDVKKCVSSLQVAPFCWKSLLRKLETRLTFVGIVSTPDKDPQKVCDVQEGSERNSGDEPSL